MIFKRNILSFYIFILSFSGLFSQSKTIRNIQFDFKQTFYKYTEENQIISGNIYFKNNPYFFVHNITVPENQTTYINTEGCFYKDKNGVHVFNEGIFVVNQTCIDFLTWFKKDYGLRNSGFIQDSYYIENNQLITVWKYDGTTSNEVQKIKTYTNNKNEIYKIETLNNNNQLVSEINLSNFYEKTGFHFPEKIITKTFSNNQIINTTALELTNVKFNQIEDFFTDLQSSTISINQSVEQNEIKTEKLISKNPIEKKYNVSISSVLVNTAYSGYKAFITKQDNSSCPFEPSCSQYMRDAVSQNGLFGFIQGLERLRRCTNEEHSTKKYIKNQKGKHVDPVSK